MSLSESIKSPQQKVTNVLKTADQQLYLRVHISDAGSTVIPVSESMTLTEILLAVCLKRGLPASTLKLSVVYKTGTEESEVDQSRTFGDFKNVDYIKIINKSTSKYLTESILNLSGCNIGSMESVNVLAKGKSKEDIRSGMFPKTRSAFTTSSGQGSQDERGTSSPSLLKKIGIAAVEIFGQVEVKEPSQDGSDVSETKLYQQRMSNGSASISSGGLDSDRRLSLAQTQSQLSQPQNQSFYLASRKSSFVNITPQQSAVSFNATLDKLERDSNTPKPDFLTKEGATLKQLSVRVNRSRANTDGIQEVHKRASIDSNSILADDKPDKQYVNLIVTLPNFRSVTIRAPTDLPMDAILNFVCSKHGVDFETHTFHRNDGKEIVVEMDRTLGYVAQELKIEEVFIVPEDKIYRSTYLSEDGNDVMMLQTIQGRLQVMAGTPQKLIARLTDEEGKNDHDFIETFLLTFRYFMPADECFRHVVSRYNCVPPNNPTEDDLAFYNKMKLPIQQCVASILEVWAAGHWHDFALSSELKANLIQMAQEFMYNDDISIRSHTPRLLDIIEKQTHKYEEMYSYYKMVERKGKVLESMLLELSPEILSHQICIHNFKLFRNIHPIEFLHQIWGSDREMTPYLNFFIDRFDKESYWVATEIVMQKDLKKRVNVLKTFILTTKACQEANNFFSLFSFMSGLGLSPVSRLKKTWEALPDKAKQVYEELEKIIDPSRNMKNYRDLLAKAVPPIVPFLPIYLKDLTFMNDGNSKMVEGMINFEKLRMMGNRVKDIVSLVAVEYKGAAMPHIQNYIAKPPVEKNMAKLKEMSLECEKP
ncbi:hypothetical protein HDU79_008232 [Rhizoclosmatium sp. JEL0117]|nr:hypothetical protein HDU79_008232 [Rhizoclosmatium sp. JEL0117]